MTSENRADDSDVGHDLAFAVRWKNFRAFSDTEWVMFKPLTLLLGSNSAGKSSLVAPLLLLKQSLFSRTGTNALLTRGEFVDVGVYRDFVKDHNVDSEVAFGLRWHSHPRSRELKPVGAYAPGGLEVAFAQGVDVQSVVVSTYRVEDTYRRIMLSRMRKPGRMYSTWMASPAHAPGSRKKRRGKADVAATRAMRAAITDARPHDFLFRSRDVRRAAIEARRNTDEPSFRTTIDDDRSRLYCSITDHTEWGLLSMLDCIHYIGPLREPPRRVYELSGEMPDAVGTKGEYAPEIVYRWRKKKSRMRDVNRWLRHFGFEDDLVFKEIGTGGFGIEISRNGETVASSFVDTGFGMSQVLPLIVQGLLSEPGDWIVMEQPEIHLNPRLQTGVADLCASIVNRGVGLIVESHSEHLLLRLRRLLADDALTDDQVGIYFVAQDGGASKITRVALGNDGSIPPAEWPPGFFEDALRESMALAQAQSSARKRLRRRAQREAQRLGDEV